METKNNDEFKDKKNVLEWTVFGVSVVLIVGILIFLIYETITHKTTPPEISVEFKPDPSENSPNRFYLVIKNNGGETAEEVSIELILQNNNTTMETAELNLAFVPTSSQREGWVNFSNNPAMADTIFARVISYKKPCKVIKGRIGFKFYSSRSPLTDHNVNYRK